MSQFKMVDALGSRVVKNQIRRTNRFFDDTITETNDTNTETTTIETEKKPNTQQTNPNTGKRYTQDEVNTLLKRDKDAAKKERDELRAQLEKLNAEGITQENRDALQARIDELANAGKTLEERTKESLANKDKEWAKKYDVSQGEIKKWRTEYETYRAETEVLKAGVEYKATNPSQIYRMIKSDIFYVETLDENNKGTGKYVPKMKVEVKEGNETKTLELSIPEGIKKMSEMEDFSNLFGSGASSGLGGSNNGSGTGNKGKTIIPDNMPDYMEKRKKDKNFLQKVSNNK